MENKTYDINTVLRTRDGRICGNGIVVGHRNAAKFDGRNGILNLVKTDYGNIMVLSNDEIKEMFYSKIDKPGSYHKYYVYPQIDATVEKAILKPGNSWWTNTTKRVFEWLKSL